MAITLSRLVRAPITDVFTFFDDPANTAEFNKHVERFEVVEVRPDGRRTFDIVMRSGAKQWTQTVEQIVREPPDRLTTRGMTWDTDRHHWLLTITTDRRLSPEGNGTRVDVTIETHMVHPLRQPLQAVGNWLNRGAARREFEQQFALMAERMEGQR